LFVCYHQGKLIDKDSQKAWDLLWEAARAGSQFAQGQVMFYIMETRNFSCSTAEERRDWSLACLMPKSHLGHKLFKNMDAATCEKGLRAAVYDHCTALARRVARRDSILPLAKLIQDRLEPQHWSSVSPLIPNLTLAVSGADFESLQKLLSTNVSHNHVREVLLRALLEYAVLNRQKQLMYFLFSRYSVDALAKDPKTQHNALTLAIFEDRNDVVTWLLDLGVDRKLFACQLIFGRVVCNSTWTMTTTYIQACWTYYRDFGLKKLLNESAPPVRGKNVPPPLILSILARNEDSFEALLRYNADVNQRWGIWAPLLLTVAHGLPHFTAQLIEKGANITDCTTDDAAMTIAHVLADAQASNATNEDQFLWDVFDRALEDRPGSPLTPSQARRYTDYLLYAMLRDIGVPFDVRDGAGKLPLEVAISSDDR
jgi:ankyrin repeat protein